MSSAEPSSQNWQLAEWSLQGTQVLEFPTIQITSPTSQAFVHEIPYKENDTLAIPRTQFFVHVLQEPTYPNYDLVFGKKVFQENLENIKISPQSILELNNRAEQFSYQLPLNFNGEYDLEINIFHQEAYNYEQKEGDVNMDIVVMGILIKERAINYVESSIATMSTLGIFDLYGFFLMDIEYVNKKISEQFGSTQINLIDKILSTELIEELSKEGAIAYVWGTRPWGYRIVAVNAQAKPLQALGKNVGIQGVYRLSEQFKSYSIVPSYELRDWNTCIQKEYPKIKLSGKSNALIINTYVTGGPTQINPNGGMIPTFTIEEQELDKVIPKALTDILPMEAYEEMSGISELINWQK